MDLTIRDVLLLLLVSELLQCPGYAAGQFTAPPPTCPGDTFTFRCTVTGDMNGITIWRVGGTSECPLTHNTAGTTSNCGPGNTFIATPGTGFGTSATSYSSTLSGTATSILDRTVVDCFGPALSRDAENRVGNSILQISGPPTVSTFTCVDLSGNIGGAVNITVSWTLSDGDSADSYLISITTNAPQTPYGGLLNITNASVTEHELSGFMIGYEYNITVRGICGGQEGRESEPLAITLQVPNAPTNCATTVIYNLTSETLLSINSTWQTVPDPVDPCPGVSGDITQYQISFQTGSVVTTENVNIDRCAAGTCNCSFVPPSNPPSSYGSVSVAAENVVGVGAARTCTTQAINMTNNLLTGEIVVVSSPSDARLNCTFLSGFIGSACCRVQYGTDPTYVNLPYSAESTENSTAGDTVSVVLREQLNSSTVYYYTVSAVSADITVTVQGTFTTPQYSCNITELWNLRAPGATFRPDVNFLDDATQYPSCDDESVGSAVLVLVDTGMDTATVAYYTGTTPGSRVCFVCDENIGYELNNTNVRVCQRNGLWSGNPTVCECILPPWITALVVMSIYALVIAVVAALITIVDGFIVCYSHGMRSYIQENKNWIIRWFILLGIVAICLVVGISLCITGTVKLSNPTNDNVCDPSMRSMHNGVIISGFVFSFLAVVLTGAAVWHHVYRHREPIKKECRIPLIVAAVFTITGIGILIALMVIGYIHYTDGTRKKPNPKREELKPDVNKLPLLHKAVLHGGLNEVKHLVKEGADISIKDSQSGMTPLHIAAEEGHMDIVQYLVDSQAHINARDNHRKTPLHVAAVGGHIEIVKYLHGKGAVIRDDNNERVPVYMAAGNGRTNIVEYFIDKGADVNRKDVLGVTLLHLAAEGGHTDTVEYLVSKEADVNITDKHGETPLHLATKQGHTDVVKCLYEKGADMNIMNLEGRTALHIAARRADVETVQYLVDRGAHINAQEKSGWTPVYMAAEGNHLEMLKYLVNKGADINIKDNDGRTPLDVAVKRNNKDVIEYLRKAVSYKLDTASPRLMYAEVGSQVRPAAVKPPSIDDPVRYTSLSHVQSRAKDPAGTPSINVDVTSLPNTPLESEGSLPPPIPPQQFSADDPALSPKLLETSELHQSERDAPPPRPPKTNQEDAAPPPRPPKTHQENAVPPPRPPKTHLHTAEIRKKQHK